MSLSNKMKLIALSLLCPMIIISCTSPSGVSKQEYLSGSNTKDSKSTIVSNLTRSDMAMGFLLLKHRAEAFPITNSYFVAKVTEEAKKEGLSSHQINEKISKLNNAIKDCSCFSVEISSAATPDAVNLKYWGATIIQQGKVYKASFQNPEQWGLSHTTRYYSANTIGDNVYVNHSDSTIYYNSDELCTSKGVKIDYVKPFELRLQPRYKENLKPLVLRWEGAAQN